MLVMLDIETDGLRDDAAVIQVATATVDFEDRKLRNPKEWKISFDSSRSEPEALEKNSYTQEGWRDAISPGEFLKDISAYLRRHGVPYVSRRGSRYKAARLVTFNGAAFDIPRLQAFAKANGTKWLPIGFDSIDLMHLAITMKFMKGWEFEGARLEDFANFLNLLKEGEEQTHDAFDDIRLTAKLFLALVEMIEGDTNGSKDKE